MARDPFGWSYPAGAEHDPSAPWNQPDQEPLQCPDCGGLDTVCTDYEPADWADAPAVEQWDCNGCNHRWIHYV